SISTSTTNVTPIIMTLDDEFNSSLSIGSLQSTLQQLTFGAQFNQVLTNGVLPESLIKITFGRDYNQSIITGILPNGLQSLTFGNSFNRSIAIGSLPESITELTFGTSFNQPIKPGSLPPRLITLTFGSHFNVMITAGTLPDSLTALAVGNSFQQTLRQDQWPASLTQITYDYSQRMMYEVMMYIVQSYQTPIIKNRIDLKRQLQSVQSNATIKIRRLQNLTMHIIHAKDLRVYINSLLCYCPCVETYHLTLLPTQIASLYLGSVTYHIRCFDECIAIVFTERTRPTSSSSAVKPITYSFFKIK
ncbi:hypothetical protein SAMD00019534_072550, partial [Acytostelium subglobosum LB1]|uniref:hypothetical protein n=1 Tax=Acytostelium subglobosum LB1 TaxID=1410327 RepID=UPI000644DDAE